MFRIELQQLAEHLGRLLAERLQTRPKQWGQAGDKSGLCVFHKTLQHGSQRATPLPQENAATMEATLLPGPDGTFAFRLYVGPQEPQRLAELGNYFQDVNPFGWRAFRPILRPLGHAIQWALYGMHDLLGLGYGWNPTWAGPEAMNQYEPPFFSRARLLRSMARPGCSGR